MADFRSSHLECSIKKALCKNFAMFTRKHPCWNLFLINLQAQASNFIKKRLQHRCFPVNIAKLLSTPILKNIGERLLLLFVSLFNPFHATGLFPHEKNSGLLGLLKRNQWYEIGIPKFPSYRNQSIDFFAELLNMIYNFDILQFTK